MNFDLNLKPMRLNDPFKRTKKQKKREVLSRSKEKGKMGETAIALQYGLGGYEVERTPRGKDFTVRKRDLLTGRVTQTKYIEVKTGRAKLSKLQEKTKKKKKGSYKVERVSTIYDNF